MKTNLLAYLDFDRINTLLEGFNKSTGFVTAILDLDGNVLSKSGWRNICTQFHRVNPETSKKCTESDTELANKMAVGEKYHFYKCLNGLVDVAVPLVINGEHIANLFSGQFFFEEPDRDLFLKQAKKYGFDNEKYMKALAEVPVFSEDRVKPAMDFLLNMTAMIADMTMQRLDQVRLTEENQKKQLQLKDQNEAIAASSAKLKFIQQSSGVGLWDWDMQTNLLEWSPELFLQFGLDSEKDQATFENWDKAMHPSDKEAAYAKLNESIANHTQLNNEYRVVHPDGKVIWINAIGNTTYDSDGTSVRNAGICIDITERKLLEEKLTESEERMRLAVTNSPVPIMIHDDSDNVILLSKGWTNFSGYTIEDIPTLADWTEKAYGTRSGTEKEYIDKLFLISETVDNGEWTVRTKDGNVRIWSFQTTPLGNVYNGRRVLHSMAIDITEHKKAQEALQQSEEMMRTSQSVAHICSYSTNLNVNEIEKSAWVCSPEFYSIFGIDETYPHTIAGWAGFIHPDYREEVFAYHESVVRERKSFNREYKILRINDGAERWVHGTGELEYDEQGNPIRMYGAIQDITERKLAEEHLKTNQILLRSLIESTTDAVYIKDQNGKYTIFNKAASAMVGKSAEEVIGKTDIDVFPLEDGNAIMEADRKIMESGIVNTIEEYITLADGMKHYFLSTKGPLFSNDGMLTGLFGIARDITERKQAEEKIKDQLNELRRWNDALLDREERVLELKSEVNELLKEFGKPLKYDSV